MPDGTRPTLHNSVLDQMFDEMVRVSRPFRVPDQRLGVVVTDQEPPAEHTALVHRLLGEAAA